MLINLNLDIKISIWCKKLEKHKLKSESQTKQGFLCSKQGDIRIFFSPKLQKYKSNVLYKKGRKLQISESIICVMSQKFHKMQSKKPIKLQNLE